MTPEKVTILDVAERAGVSRSAVSLAFNNPSRLADDTVATILKVASELGYSRSPAAYMLRTQRTGSLGVLFPQSLDEVLENPYYPQFLRGVGQACERETHTLLLLPPQHGLMAKNIPTAAVDAFIVLGLQDNRGEIEALRQRNSPFILVDSEHFDDTASLTIDEESSMAELIRHLYAHGHRQFGIIAFEAGPHVDGDGWHGVSRRRIDGITSGFASVGMSLDGKDVTVVESRCTREGGATAFKQLWDQPAHPTAIVAFSDIIAFGVLEAAREAGISVPQDVSVTGFDDLEEASWTNPTLTTIRQPITTKGRLAAEYLIDELAGSTPTRPTARVLGTSLLLRESTGPTTHPA